MLKILILLLNRVILDGSEEEIESTLLSFNSCKCMMDVDNVDNVFFTWNIKHCIYEKIYLHIIKILYLFIIMFFYIIIKI